MLSIGRIGSSRKQQLYYEETVARGREDYYAGKGEAPGRWAGRGARRLGLSGELDAEKLAALMDGMDPGTGEQLALGRSERSTSGFDLTFSAPKSVSVLIAVGDERLGAALIEAHEEAVDAALAYLEERACQVRRGHNGTRAEREAGLARGWEKARAEPAGGFVAAAYRHRMSRAQDPQLHTHVVTANMARGADGRWTALYAKPVYEHAKAAGSVYQAHLRQAVRERLRWAEWGAERNGMAELGQVPAGVVLEFSTRRRQIEERAAELAAAGIAVGAEGYQRVALDTREAKREVDEPDWRDTIRARAAEHGLGDQELAELLELPTVEPAADIDEARLAERLFGPAGLTAKENTFTGQDVVAAVAAAHGQGGTAGEVIAIADRLLGSAEVVRMPGTERPLYTTQELLAAERRIVEHARTGRGARAAVVDEGAIVRTLAGSERPLSDEQAEAVRSIATSGNRIDTVEALAGTGKTTSAAALREVYEQAGYRVIGAAPTGRAIRELVDRAGIAEARTLDGWAVKLSADPDALRFLEIDPVAGARRMAAVLIIDEAGMAHTRVSAQVIDAAIDARVKVVAIGDSGQLSSVHAGGWLGALTRRYGSHRLVEVMRQRDPHERKGLARVHVGQPDEYLELKTRRRELRVCAGRQPGVDAEADAVRLWSAACDEYGVDEVVLICRDNQRRDRLNDAARTLLVERGELGEAVEIAGREWAVGDRVIARRNDRGRDLDNGMRGTVVDVNEDRGLTVRIDAGENRQLDPEYVAGHLEHAYALTGHGMQGGTVEWAGVIGQAEDFTRNWSYTALSRARHPTQILVIDEPTWGEQAREEIAPANPLSIETPLGRLASRMRDRDDEDLALEQLERAELAAGRHDDEPAVRQVPAAPAGTPDHRHDQSGPSTSATRDATNISPVRQELAGIRGQLGQIRDALTDPALEDAQAIRELRATAAAIHTEGERDTPGGWRGRGAHQLRRSVREQRLAELDINEQALLDRLAGHDPEELLAHAEQLRERQGELLQRDGQLNNQAVADELAANPEWLQHVLGPQPQAGVMRDRWQRTANQIASHRIRNDITSPVELGVTDRDQSLVRAIAETRCALGLEQRGPEREHGRGIDA
jgi:conjugative relaxase-like TrwC/TraI family protein